MPPTELKTVRKCSCTKGRNAAATAGSPTVVPRFLASAFAAIRYVLLLFINSATMSACAWLNLAPAAASAAALVALICSRLTPSSASSASFLSWRACSAARSLADSSTILAPSKPFDAPAPRPNICAMLAAVDA